MTVFLDPTGRPTYGVGLCARCSKKFFLDELFDDPNTPGLKVCAADMDEYDPYRLPARQTEKISLPFTRPDVPLTFDANDIPASQRPPGDIFLSGSGGTGLVTLSWTMPSEPASGYKIYRNVDGGAFAFLAAVSPSTTRTYNDATVDRSVHDYQYCVVYVDSIFGIDSLPSNTITMSKISAIVTISVPVTPRAMRSIDGGLTWSLAGAFPLPASGAFFNTVLAYSSSRNRVVAAGGAGANSNVAYSDDLGQTWTLVNKGSAEIISSGCYASWLDAFFIGGYFDGVNNFPYLRSLDGGLTWAHPATTGAGNGQPMKNFVAIPELQIVLAWTGNQLWYTSNGTAWTNTGTSFLAVTHGEQEDLKTGANYNAAANRLTWAGSTNGNFWNASPPTAAAVDSGVAGGGSSNIPCSYSPDLGLYVALGSSDFNIRTSANATAWSVYASPSDMPLDALLWTRSGLRYVAVGSRNPGTGARGRIATSSTGLNGSWTVVVSPDNDVNTRWGAIVECR